jgi:hypothetical protein
MYVFSITVVSLIPSSLVIGPNLAQNVYFLALRVYIIPTFVIDPDVGDEISLRVTRLVIDLNLEFESLNTKSEVTFFILRAEH